MGELKFNPDLCVFEEDDDPLHNSLHLEDLQNLSYDISMAPSSSSCCSCSDETSAALNPVDADGKVKSSLELKFDHETLTTSHEGSAVVEEDAKNANPLVPSISSVQVCSDVSTLNQTRATNVDSSESNPVEEMVLDVDEMVPAPPSFEDDDFFTCSDSTSVANNESDALPFQYSTLQEEAEYTIRRIHSRKVLEMMEKENQERRVQLMPQNDIQKLTRSTSRKWRMGRKSSHIVGSKKNYVDLDSNKDTEDFDTRASSSKEKSLHHNNILRNKSNDAVSYVSSSGSLASRLSKALTPKWIKRRKEKSRQEKYAVARARALMFLRNNRKAQENSSMRDDDSIMTSVPIQNDYSAGDIIENIEKLDSISLHDPYGCSREGSHSRTASQSNDSLSGVSKTLTSSLASSESSWMCCNKTGNVPQQYPQSLNHIVRMHSAPIIRGDNEKQGSSSNTVLLERRSSLNPTKINAKHVIITAHHKGTSISTSKSQKDSDIPCSSISWKRQDSVEIECDDDNQDDASFASVSSSIGSKSVSANHYLTTQNETIPELTKCSLKSPNLLRTYSLPSPLPQLHSSSPCFHSAGGSEYASHLLCCHYPSPTGSVSSTFLSSPSCLESPTTSTTQSMRTDNSDCNSTASAGFSVSSSTYTAISNNISYKDPCAKQSKIIKRSNLDISSHGDGDIWVERIFVSKRTGKRKIFFVSVATGRKVRDEPPTGASKVLYQDDLQELRRLEAQEEETKRKNQGVVERVSPVSLSSGLAAC